ncbi:MAG: DNA adenine methylase [Candidatus Sericytochromatia bacterium]|nr:DNA adenine methylase [Candidatus Sericytochromatia bacterium]
MPVRHDPAAATVAGPFLKWAGGKTRLLPELLRIYRALEPAGGYHEPFLGGGALFFRLAAEALPRFGRRRLADRNPHLIDAYVAVRDEPEALLDLLEEHAARHGPDHYRTVRSDTPATALARAARFIYLNRTCFNGLYRENARGEFNVPMGRYRNPGISDRPRILAASRVLSGVELLCQSFTTLRHEVLPGDFVYLDPPYHPLSATSSFTRYVGEDFGMQGQQAVRDLFLELDALGAHVLVSNSDTPFIRQLFEGWPLQRVDMPRSINSRVTGRGMVAELLVCNRPVLAAGT